MCFNYSGGYGKNFIANYVPIYGATIVHGPSGRHNPLDSIAWRLGVLYGTLFLLLNTHLMPFLKYVVPDAWVEKLWSVVMEESESEQSANVANGGAGGGGENITTSTTIEFDRSGNLVDKSSGGFKSLNILPR